MLEPALVRVTDHPLDWLALLPLGTLFVLPRWLATRPHFPSLPIWRRAIQDAEMSLATLRGAYLLAAVSGVLASFALFHGVGAYPRIVNGVGSATIGVWGVYGLAILWRYLQYRRSGYGHDRWVPTCTIVEHQARVRLDWPSSGLSQDISQLGLVGYRVRRPDGVIGPLQRAQLWFGGGLDTGGEHAASGQFPVTDDGIYEIRWYSDPNDRKRQIEICRAYHTLRDGQVVQSVEDGRTSG